jgi:hypothetical protein
MTKLVKPVTIYVTGAGITNPNVGVPVGGTVTWVIDSTLLTRVTFLISGQDYPYSFQDGSSPYEHIYRTAGVFKYDVVRRQLDGSTSVFGSGTVTVGR